FERPEAAIAIQPRPALTLGELYQIYGNVPGAAVIGEALFPGGKGFDPKSFLDAAFAARLARTVFTFAPLWFGAIPLLLAGAGIVTLASSSAVAKGVGFRGLVLSVSGGVLALGPFLPFAGQRLWLPYAALSLTAARFFRFPWRFFVLTGFGTS